MTQVVVAALAPTDLRPEVDPISGQVSIDWRRADLTASDQAALELALQAGEAWGVETVAVAAGPRAIDHILRAALAVGARARRVAWADDELAADSSIVARALASAIEAEGEPLLVVCGDRSSLRGTGAVPAYLAGFLGAAQALGLVSLQIGPDPESLRGERRLDGGWREQLRVPTPAVCSVEAAGIRLRRAPLAAALAATDRPVPVHTGIPGSAPHPGSHPSAPRPYRPRTKVVPAPTGSTRDRLLALTGALDDRQPPRLVGPVDPPAAAAELLAFLRHHDYL